MEDVAAITKQEIIFVSRFVELLKKEQEMLKRGKASDLADINVEKISLVEQLNLLETNRRQALKIKGDEDTRDAMRIWLGGQPKNQTAAVNWENLLDLAREAKQLHEVNASLIGMKLQQTNEALAILRKPAQHSLYGSDGQTSQFSGSRIVDSA